MSVFFTEGQVIFTVPVACSRGKMLRAVQHDCTSIPVKQQLEEMSTLCTQMPYQASDDFDCRLIASIAASPNKHCKEYSYNKMLLQKLLILLKHKR